MKARKAVEALSSLAQNTRLAIYRLLIQSGPDGLAAGVIAEKLGVPPSSLSFHLAHLTRSGLVRQRRASRSLIYAADYNEMNHLMAYLTENCCGGQTCAPVCQPTKTVARRARSKAA